MTDREKLVERYEDALFALLMDEVACQEGERAIQLNEQLNQDPQFALPEDLQKKCKRTIRQAFAKQNMVRMRRGTFRVFQRISVAAMLVALLVTTALAVSEPLRRMALNALVTIEEQYTQIQFAGENGLAPETTPVDGVEYHYNIGLEWIPDGYQLTDGYVLSDGDSDVYYQSGEDREFEVMVTRYSSGLTYTYDTENATIEDIEIQGHQAQLITKEIDYTPGVPPYTQRKIVWLDDEKQAVFNLWGTHLSEEEIIRMAEGLHWVSGG